MYQGKIQVKKVVAEVKNKNQQPKKKRRRGKKRR